MIFTKIFALALTVLEIFAKNHFQKFDIFRKNFQNFSFFLAPYRRFLKNFGANFFQFFAKYFQFFLKFFKIFPKFAKKSQHFHKNFRFLKKKGIAFGDGWRWWGDGGGPWGLVSKGRGYDFDVCARLEISTTTPSSIFSKFFPKISKSVDSIGVFYCLKWRPGQNLKFDQFFSAKPNIFWFFFIKKCPNFELMPNFTYNHIFRGEKVRRGMFMP